MELLMHICCANCALYPIKHLRSRGLGIKGLWFNPNIHPEDEYLRRLEAVRALEELWGLDMEYKGSYGVKDFTRAVSEHEGIRCEACYAMRLAETARTAKKLGFQGFTTSLLVSPYQKHDLIIEAGKKFEKEYDIEFFAEDFRPGWAEGRRISRELGFYRQYYCGCFYSKDERDAEKRARRPGSMAA